jgi:carboxyl-terminal processing protease
MKKRLILLLFAILIQTGYTQTDSLTVEFTALKPAPEHRRVTQIVTTLLQRNHYEKRALNDEMSSEVFDRYLEKLDYNKLYFLASDIAEFEMYRYELDEVLRSGQVNVAFDIFNRYQQRAEERLKYVFEQLEKPFDFSTDEVLELDRKDAPWAKTSEELDDLWRKRLKDQALSLKLAGKDEEGIRKTLRNRYKRLAKNIAQSQSEDVYQIFMNSFAESFDPHTNYFSPKDFDDFKIRMSQSLEGIGARLVSEDDYTKVVEIIPGGPADKSGLLHPNDKIIGVGQDYDGEIVDVVGWRIDDVVQLIRGKKGTVVRLQIIPQNAKPGAPPDTIALVRDKIKLEDQSAKMDTIRVNHNGEEQLFGVIEIPTFYSDFDAMRRGERDYKSTYRDVKKLLEELKAMNVDGVIIDLRRNGGGYLNEAVDLTGLFIEKGPVVQVRYSDGRKEIEEDNNPAVVYDGPLAVLVDRLSASASEIFAAAIQDYGRGFIVGSQTFGKGTVQRPIDLNRFVRDPDIKLGQLKLTIAKFYRVNGHSTQHAGVTPDIEFPSRFAAMDIGESSQKNALVWDQIEGVSYKKVEDLTPYVPEIQKQVNLRLRNNPQYLKLLDEVERVKKQKMQKVVSLNEAKRRAELNENKKDEESDENDIERPSDKHKDLVLTESAHILGDFVILKKAKLTNRQ